MVNLGFAYKQEKYRSFKAESSDMFLESMGKVVKDGFELLQ